jgi:hypothetical protein
VTQEEAEQEALKMLNRAMREGRRYPRRHMRFAVLVVLPLFVLFIFLVFWLFEGR